MRLTVRCIQYVVCLELHSDRTHMRLKGNALKNDIQSALAKGMRLTRKPIPASLNLKVCSDATLGEGRQKAKAAFSDKLLDN